MVGVAARTSHSTGRLALANSFGGSLGCAGYRAAAVPEDRVPAVGDSLYVVWGGNSIRDPVTF